MFKMLRKIIQHQRVTQDYPKHPVDSSLFIGKPSIDSAKCTRCGECVRRCPSAAISADPESGMPSVDSRACVFCALCEEVCPAGAVLMTAEFELAELGELVEKKIHKIFGRSLQIREVDAGSCNGCDYEINALNNPFNDIERFGIHFVASPRHADMLLVTGCASRNMKQALLKTYEATPEPRLVVAVGACACSGGIFKDTYAVEKGIDSVVPVHVYVPGCPPRPQAILYGILKAIDKL